MLPAPHSSHHQPYTQKQGNQKNTNIWKRNQTSRAQDLSHCVVWFSGFVCLFLLGGESRLAKAVRIGLYVDPELLKVTCLQGQGVL